ncbi:MAG: hypothetical protein FWC74_10285 [Candidatus Bathyarchaeota archaeon]|nr:hypothetical protein [Candidatus Termitimicrobium sp.]
MNKLILEANALFKNCGFPYYVCGGFALDIFAGKTMRPHSDVDISIFHENKRGVVAFLQANDWDIYKRVFEPGSLGGLTPIADKDDSKLDEIWVIWAIKPGSHLVPKLREGEADLYDFEILAHEQTSSTFIEIVLDHKKGNSFLCGKDKKVMRELDKAILFKDDVPYMAPEVVLFLKSPQVYLTHEIHKDKTPADFKAIFPQLPDESKRWFMNALNAAYPDGYEWLKDLL